MINIRPNRGLDPNATAIWERRLFEEREIERKRAQSLRGWSKDKPTFIQRILGMIKKPRMTMIEAADLLKTIRKDNDMTQTMIITGKGAK